VEWVINQIQALGIADQINIGAWFLRAVIQQASTWRM